jgi:hypothetical protein
MVYAQIKRALHNNACTVFFKYYHMFSVILELQYPFCFVFRVDFIQAIVEKNEIVIVSFLDFVCVHPIYTVVSIIAHIAANWIAAYIAAAAACENSPHYPFKLRFSL